ncbi:MAG: hypothetical protein BWK79_13205 [Beggiatoa sp. IS2]|nr:MAG: hypothetical protein BWK79_13205 [Beggiatoa sp. IS2]
MEELFELRAAIEQQRYADALILLGEMEEMSRDDKLHKIRSFVIILLIHLIKQAAEQRTTRSWDCSIQNAVEEIQYVNKRRKVNRYYLSEDELHEVISDAYSTAIRRAALEAFEGQHTGEQLAQQVNRQVIEAKALELIRNLPL